MTKYEQIYEALCDAVDDGELSLEEAEVINDRAYDMYATEYSSFDKAMQLAKAYDDYDDGVEKLHNKLNKKLGSKTSYEPKYRSNSAKLRRGLYEDYPGQSDENFSHVNRHNDYPMAARSLEKFRKNSKHRGYSDKEISEIRRDARKDWQRAHGDVGKRPEEKYKQNRYLDAQLNKRIDRVGDTFKKDNRKRINQMFNDIKNFDKRIEYPANIKNE